MDRAPFDAARRRAQWLWLLLAGIAFGFVEAAVVVYLRAIAYPGGFDFPLQPLDARLVATEIAREAATLLLLLGVALAARRRPLARFAAFTLLFGAWDLAYYGALKLLLDWPSGLLDWDVLFLVPAPWLAPVLAPALVSTALVACATPLLLAGPDRDWGLDRRDWIPLVLGGLLVLASFFTETARVLAGERPERFAWELFAAGMALGLAAWFRALGRGLRAGRGG